MTVAEDVDALAPQRSTHGEVIGQGWLVRALARFVVHSKGLRGTLEEGTPDLKYLSAGISTWAYLGPDGVVYKADEHGHQAELLSRAADTPASRRWLAKTTYWGDVRTEDSYGYRSVFDLYAQEYVKPMRARGNGPFKFFDLSVERRISEEKEDMRSLPRFWEDRHYGNFGYCERRESLVVFDL